MKIHITGNAGSGKTTLANKLSHELGLDVFGLDVIVWQEGWKKSSPEFKAAKIDDLISLENWIIEGVSDQVRDVADIVIFLDVNRAISYWRCSKRNWKYLFKSRPGLPSNCPEIVILPHLLKTIWRFKHQVRPKILADIAKRPQSSFRASNKGDLQNLTTKLGL